MRGSTAEMYNATYLKTVCNQIEMEHLRFYLRYNGAYSK